jgi:AcrR family transcriptional regulator
VAKQRRGEATVERALDAALAVHARDGFYGFTVHAVAAAGELSLGSLYHHFKSFDGLCAALYARCMADLLDRLVAALDGVADARTGVEALVAAYLRHARDRPDHARFIHASAETRHLQAGAERIAAVKAPRIGALRAWAAPHVAAGRIVDLPDALLEMLLIGPAAETTRRWLAGVPDLDLDAAIRLLPERTWHAVRGPVP